MNTVMSLLPGQFTVRHVRELGAGGFGSVDEVEVVASNGAHPVGTRLARKRLGPKWAADASARARFDREIDMLEVMNHPNIVPLRGVSLPGGPKWYAMPLFRKGSLRRAIDDGRRFGSVQSLAAFFATAADALAHAHRSNFIHRDVKPENILLGEDDEPVLADWGLGQFVHRHSLVIDHTRGGPMGTNYYCSMEQWATGRCEATGDVYSLGIVLAELAVGSAVPLRMQGAGIQVDVVNGATWAGRQLNAITRAMTAILARDRVQSMNEVARLLRQVASAN